MKHKKPTLRFFFQIAVFSLFFQTSEAKDEPFQYPLYIGITGGYGSTTWQNLVPPKENQNLAMSLSTPKVVGEGGIVYGVFGGYEFSPYFALEASYMRYPDAEVSFDEMSLFTFINNGETKFTTHTETLNIIGKLMLIIPRTKVRAFSSFGVANEHRRDILYHDWHLSPTFGVGFNTNVAPRLMLEVGANYTAGYGEAQLNPTEVYVPFLYSVFLRLAFRL